MAEGFTAGHGRDQTMKRMTIVLTTFPLPANLGAEEALVAFTDVAPHFRDVPGLLRKQFLLSQDGKTGGGVYLWDDAVAAAAFMSEQVAPMIRSRFRVEPMMEFFESPIMVENNLVQADVTSKVAQ